MFDHIINFLQVSYTIALPIVLGFLLNGIKRTKDTKKNSIQADMLTLRLNLIMIHDQYVPTGEISRYAFETFEEIWTLYHEGYNGNHLTQKFHDEMQNLKITT